MTEAKIAATASRPVSRPSRIVAGALQVGILGAPLVAFSVPIYSDEVATRIQYEGLDALRRYGGLPQCESTMEPAVPLSLIPGDLVQLLLSPAPGAPFIRTAAIVVGILVLWFGKLLLGRVSATPFFGRQLWFLWGTVGLVGVMPLLMGFSRPEQKILLAVLVLGVCGAVAGTLQRGRALSVLLALLCLLATSVMLSSHPKSLFLVPVALLATWRVTGPLTVLWRMAFAGAILAMSAQSLFWFRSAYSCPESGPIDQLLSNTTVNPRQPLFQLLQEGLGNLIAAPQLIADRLIFAQDMQSSWIVSGQASLIGETGLSMLGDLVKVLTLAVIVVSPVVVASLLIYKARRRAVDYPLLLAAMIEVGLIAHMFWYAQGSWHFYTPALVVPLAALALCLSLARREPIAEYFYRGRRPLALAGVLLVTLAIGLATCIVRYSIPMASMQINGRIEPHSDTVFPLSSPVLNTGSTVELIEQMREMCGIGPNPKRLLVDGTVYSGVPDAIHPFLVYYLAYGARPGETISESIDHIDSAGILTEERNFPEGFEPSLRWMGLACGGTHESQPRPPNDRGR